MTRARAACLVAVLALAASPGIARGDAMPPWVRAIDPGPGAALPDGPPAEVLLDRTSVQIEPGLRAHFTRRRVLRLLTSDGPGLASLGVRVEPGGMVEDFRAWTGDGAKARATSGASSRVESMLSREGPTDVRLVLLAAPGARAGDLVAFEARWSEIEPFPILPWWPQEQDLPCRRAEFELALPRGWSADVHAVGMAAEDRAPEPERVLLVAESLPRLPDEPMRPADSRLEPRAAVRLRDPAAPGAFADWPATGAWYAALCADRVASAACPHDLAWSAGTGGEDALRRLAAAVQHDVRYVAIELGARRWQPDSAAVTWRRRYGDCKDKAALLVSALASAGIEARMTLACARMVRDVDTSSADPLQFNHCIVAVRWPGAAPPAGATVTAPGGTAWTLFDPTDDGVPLGAISHAMGGTWAVVSGAGGGLVRIPPATPSTVRHRVDATLAPDGTLAGTLRLEVTGPLREPWHGRFGGLSGADLRARAAEALRSRLGDAVLDSCAVSEDDAGAERFSLRLTFRLPGAARESGGRRVLRPRFDDDGAPAPPQDSARVSAVELGATGRFEQEWNVSLPPGVVAETRAPIEWHGPCADYVAAFEAGPGTLRVRRTYELREGELPPERWAEAKAVLRARWAGEHASVALKGR